MTASHKPDMPDVAADHEVPFNETLNWAGMSRIALPLTIHDQDNGNYHAHTFVENYVDVCNPKVKGIHMSRMYLLLAEFSQHHVLTMKTLKVFLQDTLSSHTNISRQTCLQIDFDYLLRQPALKSPFSGWKDYPVSLKAQYNGKTMDVELAVKVPYSSTCPCSAALSRQLLQEAFSNDFSTVGQIDKQTVEEWLRSERGSVATAHSQRSYAHIWVKPSTEHDGFPINRLITLVEDALKTAVQTAVKREDEQEFARLNGANQMFCEDAARRLKHALNQQTVCDDFWVRIEHLESLHAHDAVSIVTKGIAGGYTPLLHR